MGTNKQKLELCRIMLALTADRITRLNLEGKKVEKIIDDIDMTIEDTKPEGI